jgi:hypothetical protein
MRAEQYDTESEDSDVEAAMACVDAHEAAILAIDAAVEWQDISEEDILKHLVDAENKRREKRRKGIVPPKPLGMATFWDEKSQDWKPVDNCSLPTTWERLQNILASYHAAQVEQGKMSGEFESWLNALFPIDLCTPPSSPPLLFPNPVLPNPVLPNPVLPNSVLPNPVLPNPVLPNPGVENPMQYPVQSGNSVHIFNGLPFNSPVVGGDVALSKIQEMMCSPAGFEFFVAGRSQALEIKNATAEEAKTLIHKYHDAVMHTYMKHMTELQRLARIKKRSEKQKDAEQMQTAIHQSLHSAMSKKQQKQMQVDNGQKGPGAGGSSQPSGSGRKPGAGGSSAGGSSAGGSSAGGSSAGGSSQPSGSGRGSGSSGKQPSQS